MLLANQISRAASRPILGHLGCARVLRSNNAITKLLSQNRILEENPTGLKSIYRNDSSLSSENNKKQDLDGNETPLFGHRFIPMTRRTLCRKLLEDSNLYAASEHLKLQDLIVGIDTAISRGFHGTLGDIKALYDPMNPDKETMVVSNVSKNERLDNEFWLLQKLSKLLEKANFYELPPEHITAVLTEHPVFEGVLVSVDPKKYDVIRFWVLGEEIAPVEFSSATDRVLYYSKVLMRKAPREIPRYKRVVLAVRTKKQNKLMLKSFKDIPANSLEYLLPEGKIRMSKYDKSFIATTVFIGLTTGLIKLVATLADYNIQWTYIAGIAMGLLALRAWNAYKNKRNMYLMSLSRLLYFKTVANNRALLALIVDRAQDETFKSALLTYSFLRVSQRHVADAEDPAAVHAISGMTAEELKESIETWMNTKYKLNIEYDAEEPLKQLEDIGLLTRKTQNGKEILQVLSLVEALKKVPIPHMPVVMERNEDLDVDQVAPDSDTADGNGDDTVEKNNNYDTEINWK